MLRKQFLVNFGLSLCLGLLNDGLDSEAFVRVLLAEIELEVRHLGLRTLLFYKNINGRAVSYSFLSFKIDADHLRLSYKMCSSSVRCPLPRPVAGSTKLFFMVPEFSFATSSLAT